MNPFRGGVILALGIGMMVARAASAQTIALNNLPGTAPFTSGNTLGDFGNVTATRGFAAVELTNNGPAASLVDVSAVFTNFDGTNNRVVTGGVYSSVGGSPGTQLVAFNQQTILAGQADITKNFLPSAPFTLAAGVDYWFVFAGDVGNFNGALTWRRETANTAPTAAPNFASSGYKASTDNAATWGASNNNNLVRIRVNVAPEPASLALMGIGVTLLGIKRRRRG